MRAVGGAGIAIPAEAGQGAAAPYRPPRVPAALAVVLSEAGGVWLWSGTGDEGGRWRPEDAFRSEAEKGTLSPLNPWGERQPPGVAADERRGDAATPPTQVGNLRYQEGLTARGGMAGGPSVLLRANSLLPNRDRRAG